MFNSAGCLGFSGVADHIKTFCSNLFLGETILERVLYYWKSHTLFD